jgi:hypothetical protein
MLTTTFDTRPSVMADAKARAGIGTYPNDGQTRQE